MKLNEIPYAILQQREALNNLKEAQKVSREKQLNRQQLLIDEVSKNFVKEPVETLEITPEVVDEIMNQLKETRVLSLGDLKEQNSKKRYPYL